MNIKRLILAIIAGWVVIFATDFPIHEIWLKPVYEATKPLWRPDNEMHTRVCWMFFAQFLIAATFAIVWAKGFAGRSIGTAVAFGLFMGLFQQTWAIILFVVMPMPAELAVKWFFSGLAQAVLLGIVTSLVYKPEPSSAP
jgi:hypothetical protein